MEVNNHAGRDQRQATSYAIRASIIDKVAAAKEAGVSPLYALGAPVMSTTSAVGSPSSGPSLGQTLSNMGTDVSRAVATMQTADQRLATKLALEGASLDNDLKRAQIASTLGRVGQGAGPPRPNIELPLGLGTVTPGGKTRAMDVQNEYGSILEDVFGIPHFVEDAGNSFLKWYMDPAFWRGAYGGKGAPLSHGDPLSYYPPLY